MHIILFFLLLATSAHAKVYDCFMFFNEIELLKMRLEELDPVVDQFVLVECAETQKGEPKSFCFNENRQLFEKYLHKITHVMVHEKHASTEFWGRENFQRNCIMRGLQNCQASDIILISDLDEIPRPEIVQKLSQSLPNESSKLMKEGVGKKFKVHNKKKSGPGKAEKMFYLKGALAFEMAFYCYQLNRQTPTGERWGGGPWVGTVATTYEMVQKFGVQHFRDYRWKFPREIDSGWHFTWMGGKDKIRQKMRSIIEGNSEIAKAPDEEIDEWINKNPAVPIDARFPRYVQKNYDYLYSLGFIADVNLSQ